MNKITIAFMAVWTGFALAADVVFAYKWGEVGTISWQLVNVMHQWIIIPFAIGILMGHLMWQLRSAPKGPIDEQKQAS